jgi:hypothetical protein
VDFRKSGAGAIIDQTLVSIKAIKANADANPGDWRSPELTGSRSCYESARGGDQHGLCQPVESEKQDLQVAFD